MAAMQRGLLLALVVAGAAAPLVARAQPRPGVARIGILFFGPPARDGLDTGIAGLQKGLRELGYVEGRNFILERRYADGRPERLDTLAAELVHMKVDIILAGGPPPREAASRATRTLPIVTVSGADPVREGWAKSLARPGGNITGMTVTDPELDLKRLEILKQGFPHVIRVAVLNHPGELLDVAETLRTMHEGARHLGLELQIVEVRGADSIDAAFAEMRRRQAQAVYVIATNTLLENRSHIAALAARDRMISVSEPSLMAQAGFLFVYGADLEDLTQRAAAQIDKILKGLPAGDLPIERPTKFLLTVNPKAARAIGLAMPLALLARADAVIP